MAWAKWGISLSGSFFSPPHHAHMWRMQAENRRPHIIPFSQFRSPYLEAPMVITWATVSMASWGIRSHLAFPPSSFRPLEGVAEVVVDVVCDFGAQAGG